MVEEKVLQQAKYLFLLNHIRGVKTPVPSAHLSNKKPIQVPPAFDNKFCNTSNSSFRSDFQFQANLQISLASNFTFFSTIFLCEIKDYRNILGELFSTRHLFSLILKPLPEEKLLRDSASLAKWLSVRSQISCTFHSRCRHLNSR